MATSVEATSQNFQQKSTMNSQQGVEFEKSDVEINQQNVKYILMDGFEYSFNRMLGDAQKWKCTNKSCYAYFKILDNLLLPGVMAHTHPRKDEASSQDANHSVLKRAASPEQQVQSPVMQSSERPGGKRTCPSQVKLDQSRNWNQHGAPSAGAKKMKLTSGKTEMKPTSPLNAIASSPSSGFVSDQDSGPAFPLAASPTNSKTPPPKSPKLSEVGPPLTPPLSQNSSQHDSNPSSPLPPIFDLVDTKCTPLSFFPCFSPQFINAPSKLNSPPQMSSAKPSASSLPHSCHNSEKLKKLAKYKEYEKKTMELDNEKFGYAVTSLLCELPSKMAEDIRYEISTLLYGAVEEYKNSCSTN